MTSRNTAGCSLFFHSNCDFVRECADPIVFYVLLVQAPSRLGHEGFCDPPLNTTESRTRENISFKDLGWLVEGKERVVTLLFQVQPCSSLRACWVVICRFYEYIRHRKQAHQRRLRTRLLLQASASQAAPLGRMRQSGKQTPLPFTHLSYLHFLENMCVFGTRPTCISFFTSSNCSRQPPLQRRATPIYK